MGRFDSAISVGLFMVVSSACSESSSPGAGGSGGGATAGSHSTTTASAGADAATGQGGSFQTTVTSTGSAAGGAGSYLVYASTDTTLFTLDPTSADLKLTTVGDFDCIDPVNGPHTAMVDVAVDDAQNLWGITGHDVYPLTIQGNTVHCGGQVVMNSKSGQSVPTFYALTFAPVGVIDSSKEVLIAGNSAGELWAVDSGGSADQHGTFGTVPADDGHGHAYAPANQGKPWELSGDIVFLANGGDPIGFATVRDCPNPPSTAGCSYVDTLIEIAVPTLAQKGAQPVIKSIRGQLVKRAGCNDGVAGDYGSMYGIAAWNDKVFGFSRTGNLVTVNTSDGGTCNVKSYSPNKFSGAGVTTLAPIIPPS